MTEITRYGTGERGIFRVTKHENEKRKATHPLVRMWRRVLRKLGLGARCEVRRAQRGCWVWREGVFIPFFKRRVVVNAPYVKRDEVDAFENPITGKMETSMSEYRKWQKREGYFEKGNDHFGRPERMKGVRRKSYEERFLEVRETVMEEARKGRYGVAESTSGERQLWEMEQRALKK